MLVTIIVLLLTSPVGFVLGLMAQTSVPVLLASHKLSTGIRKYQEEYELGTQLSLRDFSLIAEELLSKCNSDAFVFINQPGIRVHDFVTYKKELINLQRYLYASSTAIKFEEVDLLPGETYDKLIEYVEDQCNIGSVITVDGNNTDNFQPYVDVGKRIIRVDFPLLPQDDENRSIALSNYDKSLRTILAQIPTPELTLIYTSLGPNVDVEINGLSKPLEIFPDIFLDSSRTLEFEKNDRDLSLPPLFNEHHPKFFPMSSQSISIFDEKFITDNYELLRLIITILIGYVIVQAVRPRENTKKLFRRRTTKHNVGNNAVPETEASVET